MRIINHLEMDGVDRRIDSLTEEERRRVEEELASRMMKAAGYTAEEGKQALGQLLLPRA